MNSKFFVTLIGLFLAILAICNVNFKENAVENFGFGQQGAVKVYQSVKTPSGHYGLRGIQSPIGNKFVSYPNMQSLLSPRMSGGTDFGSAIRYNMPDRKNMGVDPCDPLSTNLSENFTPPTTQLKENYATYGQNNVGGCAAPTCGRGGVPLPTGVENPLTSAPSNFTTGDFHDVMSGLRTNQQIVDSLPVAQTQTVNAAGESVNPVVYNNYIYANRRSRLNGLGDRIRGDLAIAPCNTQWFRPSVNPSIDLTQGAMSVIGGVGNESSRALAHMVNEYSGGAEQTIGGVDYSNFNIASQFGTQIGGGHSDVAFTAFP